MATEIVQQQQNALVPQIMESVMMAGDLSKLTPQQRVDYYGHVCNSMNLNPLTKPFDYISLNGKLTLYATKNCTDQLRSRDSVSIKISNRQVLNGIYLVTVAASTPDGRVDESTGAVNVEGLKGEVLANAYMKAETKAKRRATLSICGMGLLDELEVEDTPSARPVHVDKQTGKISEGTGTVAPAPPPTTGQGAAVQQPAAQTQAEVDPAFYAISARMNTKATMTAELEKLHQRCLIVLGPEAGESRHRQVLGRFGVQSANDFKSRNPAVECAKFIWESLNAIEADQAKEKAGQPAAAEIPEEIWPEEPAQ